MSGNVSPSPGVGAPRLSPASPRGASTTARDTGSLFKECGEVGGGGGVDLTTQRCHGEERKEAAYLCVSAAQQGLTRADSHARRGAGEGVIGGRRRPQHPRLAGDEG